MIFICEVGLAMDFHQILSKRKITAAGIISAFPNIPKSTAYDWISGYRKPAKYLQPVILQELARHQAAA